MLFPFRNTWVSGPKFPKLDECTHFHYDVVNLAPDFSVSIRGDYGDHELHISKTDGTCITVFYVSLIVIKPVYIVYTM